MVGLLQTEGVFKQNIIMKYRVLWNTETKVVVTVVADESGTITSYSQEFYEHAVVGDLATISAILEAQNYDITVIDDFIANNP